MKRAPCCRRAEIRISVYDRGRRPVSTAAWCTGAANPSTMARCWGG